MDRTFIAAVGDEHRQITEQRLIAEFSGAGGSVSVITSSPAGALLEVRHRGLVRRVFITAMSDGTQELWIDRFRIVVSLQEERHQRLSAFIRAAQKVAAGSSVRAPMPGLIKEFSVRKGDPVKKGQRLLTLEAMKMENEIVSPADGIVDECPLAPGTNVEKGQEIIHIIPSSGQ